MKDCPGYIGSFQNMSLFTARQKDHPSVLCELIHTTHPSFLNNQTILHTHY